MKSSLLSTMNATLDSGWRELPPIVNESLVHQFMYWEEQVKVGMRYGMELYALVQSYPVEERLKACDLGCEYQLRGADVCITASKTTYTIWLNLKSLSALSNDSFAVIHSAGTPIWSNLKSGNCPSSDP